MGDAAEDPEGRSALTHLSPPITRLTQRTILTAFTSRTNWAENSAKLMDHHRDENRSALRESLVVIAQVAVAVLVSALLAKIVMH